MKKIAIDVRAASGARAGKGQYTFELVSNLLRLDKENQYILYAKEDLPELSDFKNAELRLINKGGLFWHRAVAKDCQKEQVDIFWAPGSYITPVLIKKNIKVFVSVHDLVAFIYAHNHNKKATILEKLFLKKAVKKAHKILVVSEHTKKDLVKYFPKSKDKIEIVYCAASDFYRPEKVNKNEFFFLAVGTLQPRKNYLNLVRAFAEIAKDYPGLKLKIVGKEGWKYQEIYGEIARNNLEDKVKIMGYLADQEIHNLYLEAEALVFPSFYEGFGIPPLEAMQSGCPVISSSNSSIPEVVGEAGLVIDPKSSGSIAEAMRKILDYKHLREELVATGLKQAEKFSWEKSAKKLLKILNAA